MALETMTLLSLRLRAAVVGAAELVETTDEERLYQITPLGSTNAIRTARSR